MDDVLIRLSRGPCFGSCPAYDVAISGDGEVRYHGFGYVHLMGQQIAAIPRESVEQLVRRFDEIGFETLPDAYRLSMDDIPTYTISITRGGVTKTVEDHGGRAVGMPEALAELEAEIDRVAGTDQWVLRDGQPVLEAGGTKPKKPWPTRANRR